jgi:hypothetical protein
MGIMVPSLIYFRVSNTKISSELKYRACKLIINGIGHKSYHFPLTRNQLQSSLCWFKLASDWEEFLNGFNN